MSILGGFKLGQGNNTLTSSNNCKVERDTYVIVNKDGIAFMTDLKDYSVTAQNNSVVDSALEVLIDRLESIPENTTLVDRPVKIYVSDMIAGVVTGSVLDYVRTGKTIGGAEMPKERIASFMKVMKLMATRYMNVELCTQDRASKEDKEKFIDPAWKLLKAEISNIVRNGFNSTQPTQIVQKLEMSDRDKAKIDKLKDKLDDAEMALLDTEEGSEEERKLQRTIKLTQEMIDRVYAQYNTPVSCITTETPVDNGDSDNNNQNLSDEEQAMM